MDVPGPEGQPALEGIDPGAVELPSDLVGEAAADRSLLGHPVERPELCQQSHEDTSRGELEPGRADLPGDLHGQPLVGQRLGDLAGGEPGVGDRQGESLVAAVAQLPGAGQGLLIGRHRLGDAPRHPQTPTDHVKVVVDHRALGQLAEQLVGTLSELERQLDRADERLGLAQPVERQRLAPGVVAFLGHPERLLVPAERFPEPPPPEGQGARGVQEPGQEFGLPDLPGRAQRLFQNAVALLEPVPQPVHVCRGSEGLGLQHAVSGRTGPGQGPFVVGLGRVELSQLLLGLAASQGALRGQPGSLGSPQTLGRPHGPVEPPDGLAGGEHPTAPVTGQHRVAGGSFHVLGTLRVVGQDLGELFEPLPGDLFDPPHDLAVRLEPPGLRDARVRDVTGEDVVEDQLALALDDGGLPLPQVALLHQRVDPRRRIG